MSIIARLLDRLAFYLYYKYKYQRMFRAYGSNVRWGKHFKRLTIPSNIRISCPDKISIGDDCQFDEFVYLQCHQDSFGIQIGTGTRCNAHTHILAHSKIIIGNYVLIAPFTLISSGNHGYSNPSIPIMNQEHRPSGEIHIGAGSWLGQRASILGGVELGKNSVVATNSVVTSGKYPDHSLLVGVPAQTKAHPTHAARAK